jgi:hypothetical protein
MYLPIFVLQTDAHVDTLTSEQAAYILNRMGLTHAYNCIQQQAEVQGPLSQFQGMDSIYLKSAMVSIIFCLEMSDLCTLT